MQFKKIFIFFSCHSEDIPNAFVSIHFFRPPIYIFFFCLQCASIDYGGSWNCFACNHRRHHHSQRRHAFTPCWDGSSVCEMKHMISIWFCFIFNFPIFSSFFHCKSFQCVVQKQNKTKKIPTQLK